jgi:hypothetical protein
VRGFEDRLARHHDKVDARHHQVSAVRRPSSDDKYRARRSAKTGCGDRSRRWQLVRQKPEWPEGPAITAMVL